MSEAEPIRILLIEDTPGDVELFKLALSRAERVGFDFSLVHCDRLMGALDELQHQPFDIILSDLNLPDSRGTHTYTRLLSRAPGTPIIILTGHGDDELAVQAVQLGAQDYLVKNELNGAVLVRGIRYAIERQRLATAMLRAKEVLQSQNDTLQAQYGVTRILSEVPDLQTATPQILKAVSESLAWDMGELWMVEPEIDRLRLVDLWHTADLDLGEFENFTRQRTFERGDGFSGRVWASGEPLWMADVMNYPNFPPLAIAARAGLHGGFGFPIRLGGEVLAVVTFFSRALRPPDTNLLNMFASIGSQMGQFIERRRAEAALRESETKLNYLIRRFVPSAVADQIMASAEGVELGGERRVVSVLFADIRGYTSLTETLEPPALLDLLNEYYGIIGRVILKYGGTINQYAGDMIMASFNAPNPQPDHAARAIQAALEAQAELQAARTQQTSKIDVHFGMGVNTGAVVVGYVGFEDRFDYATLGETTNIAFRFSSMAEGGQVLTGADTLAEVRQHVEARALGPLVLKGRTAPLPVFVVEEWHNDNRKPAASD
jgi:class 3 adenylate cyclase/DNA-binding NarL/FixJ family response regulator